MLFSACMACAMCVLPTCTLVNFIRLFSSIQRLQRPRHKSNKFIDTLNSQCCWLWAVGSSKKGA